MLSIVLLLSIAASAEDDRTFDVKIETVNPEVGRYVCYTVFSNVSDFTGTIQLVNESYMEVYRSEISTTSDSFTSNVKITEEYGSGDYTFNFYLPDAEKPNATITFYVAPSAMMQFEEAFEDFKSDTESDRASDRDEDKAFLAALGKAILDAVPTIILIVVIAILLSVILNFLLTQITIWKLQPLYKIAGDKDPKRIKTVEFLKEHFPIQIEVERELDRAAKAMGEGKVGKAAVPGKLTTIDKMNLEFGGNGDKKTV